MVSPPSLPSEVFAGDGDSTLMDLMDTAHAHDHDDLDEEVLEKMFVGVPGPFFTVILVIFWID